MCITNLHGSRRHGACRCLTCIWHRPVVCLRPPVFYVLVDGVDGPPSHLIQDGAKYHTRQAPQAFLAAQAARLTKFQLPAYSPDFNPIEHLWRNVKKEATHLKYFPTFEALTEKVDKTLRQITELPSHILALMGRYCESLGGAA